MTWVYFITVKRRWVTSNENDFKELVTSTAFYLKAKPDGNVVQMILYSTRLSQIYS